MSARPKSTHVMAAVASGAALDIFESLKLGAVAEAGFAAMGLPGLGSCAMAVGTVVCKLLGAVGVNLWAARIEAATDDGLNHDLEAASGRAIARVITAMVPDDPRLTKKREGLVALAQAVLRANDAKKLAEASGPAHPFDVAAFIGNSGGFLESIALEPAVWKRYLESIADAESIDRSLLRTNLDAIANALRDGYASALYDELKLDFAQHGKAFPAAVFQQFHAVLRELGELRDGVRNIDATTTATWNAVRTLRAELDIPALKAGLEAIARAREDLAALSRSLSQFLTELPAQLAQMDSKLDAIRATGDDTNRVVHEIRAGQLEATNTPWIDGAFETVTPPESCLHREREVAAIVKAITKANPGAVVVLGPAGVGKSTVIAEALTSKECATRFGAHRLQLRCDGLTSAEAVVSAMAVRIGVVGAQDLRQKVDARLRQLKAAVALDDFEVPWHADRSHCEELLQAWIGVGATIICGVRGNEAPAGVRWSETTRVEPFALDQARDVFLSIAGDRFAQDPNLNPVVERAEGIPLVLSLIASRAQDETSLAALLASWTELRTSLVARAGLTPTEHSRSNNLATSIELSLASPRMTKAGRALFATLGMLPAGMSDEDARTLFDAATREQAASLHRLGLSERAAGRERLLRPIREYAELNYRGFDAERDRIMKHYFAIACSFDTSARAGSDIEVAVRQCEAEVGNIEALLCVAAASDAAKQAIEVAPKYALFVRFRGHGTDASITSVANAARRIGDILGEANCFQSLGDVALTRSQHDRARKRFEQALPLYKAVGNIQGMANCIYSFGYIALERSHLDRARKRFEQALPLYKTVRDTLGEANCIYSFGYIALERSHLALARERFEQALPLYKAVRDMLGEANCNKSLGSIALQLTEHDLARERFEQALPLYKTVGSILGEANCIQGLGEIALALFQHETARECWRTALDLYEQIQEPYSIGCTHLRFAKHATSDADRQHHRTAAIAAWRSIGRDDLVRQHFPDEPAV